LLAISLLGLGPHVRQTTQRFTIALRSRGERIDLPIEGLVVRDDLLQRAFRRLRSGLHSHERERQARKCASEVTHDQ
jgi:hypothetical protein